MIIGTSGPTIFNAEIKSMVENFYDATPLYITQDRKQDLDWVLDSIDALILAGGRDISPMSYGDEITTNDRLNTFDFARDVREMYLIKKCFELDIPILGICRGHQILGIYHKLHLMKDITNYEVCHNPNAHKIELDNLPCHFIYCLPEYQDDFWTKEYCNSFHHQSLYFNNKYLQNYKNSGVDVIGVANITYKTSKDPAENIIELMKGNKNRWISTQNHPEISYDTNKADKIILTKFKEMIK